MKEYFKKFRSMEDGAVTVDWVVLVSAVVGLGLLAVTPVLNGSSELSEKTKAYLDTQRKN